MSLFYDIAFPLMFGIMFGFVIQIWWMVIKK